MGSSQSAHQVTDERDTESDEEEEEDERHGGGGSSSRRNKFKLDLVEKKVLEQEPEILPCHASASPLSPQLSNLGTPRLGPSIKVWDPYNVLAPPPPPPPPIFARTYSIEEERQLGIVEVFLISHGESDLTHRPDLVAGRCPTAGLTANGERQARALAVLLNSNSVRFGSVYSSPLDRARLTASLVCQEMNIGSEQIQSAESLTEMSQGQWEGCPVSDIYTQETPFLMEPDFSAPNGGESLRQVEFRMVQFLNRTVLGLPDKSNHFSDQQQQQQQQHMMMNSSSSSMSNERDDVVVVGSTSSSSSPRSDLLYRHRHRSLSRKKSSGKSRLQFVTTTEEEEGTPLTASSSSSSHCIGLFTHSVPIKCLVTGILGCGAAMAHNILVDDSSVTVLQHSWRTGWQLKRLNDTAHLRIL